MTTARTPHQQPFLLRAGFAAGGLYFGLSRVVWV